MAVSIGAPVVHDESHLRRDGLIVVLGDRYRDPISGFEGIATGRFEYLYGCERVTLEGVKADGEPTAFTFDAQQLEHRPSGTVQKEERKGGPRDTPTRDRGENRQ